MKKQVTLYLRKQHKTSVLLKQLKEKHENEEIAKGNVEIVVSNIQSHIKLILRLVKAAYQSLEKYKKEADTQRGEIFELRQRYVEEKEEVLNRLSPQLLQSYKTLKSDVKVSKTNNDLKY